MKTRTPFRKSTAVLAIGLSATLSLPSLAAPGSGSSSSGSVTILGAKALALPASGLAKWNSVLVAHRAEQQSPEWRKLVSTMASKTRLAQIESVNRKVNAVRYRDDPQDNWLTPLEFFRKGGDCEDYAIAKYLILRTLGVPAASMRIVALSPAKGVPAHAVLAVETASGTAILDNRKRGPYPLSGKLSTHFAYAVNEAQWWVGINPRNAIAAAD